VHGETPAGAPFVYVGTPGMVDGQPFEVLRTAPTVGEHSEEILTELGLSEIEVKELSSLGVI
jgi:crotonobetainyl-CoA:carnitine CoA-transferase CaiB-like acyl-CoA transferase